MFRIDKKSWTRPLVPALIIVWMIVAGLYAWSRSAANIPQRRDITGGAVVQRERIDRFIDTTEKMRFDEAIDSLRVHTEGLDLAQLASSSPGSLYIIFIRQVTADRRVARIYEEFERRSSGDRSELANNIYSSNFVLYEETWEEFRSGKREFFALVPLHHATSVGLFLCACFGTTEELIEKENDWESRMRDRKYDAIQGVELLRNFRFPDPLFILNLLVIAGERNGGDLGELSDRLDKVTSEIAEKPVLKLDTLPFFKWDAETNSTDFTHRARGIPVSNEDILISLPGFTRSSPRLSNPEIRKLLRDELEAWATGD